MSRTLKSFLLYLSGLTLVLSGGVAKSGTVTFGNGANSFSMDFVAIGDPGNLPDFTGAPNPAGSVAYTYQIGKFEVSVDMIAKYNLNFGTANSLEITQTDIGANKPATIISWNEAARFVNWLNTSTGRFAAYKFMNSGVNSEITPWSSVDTLDYDPLNPFRSKRTTYALPTTNEWYKAAYYDPNKQGGGYWDYPTGSDVAPSSVASGVASGTAVYARPFSQGPADVDKAGGLSPYGVMGLGGNVWEWEESPYNSGMFLGSAFRGVRGGQWDLASDEFLSSNRGTNNPGDDSNLVVGFRVVSLQATMNVPEPSTSIVVSILLASCCTCKRKFKKRQMSKQ